MHEGGTAIPKNLIQVHSSTFMENHDPYLQQWQQLAAQKLGWIDSVEWNDNDFEKLSQLIFTETGVRLSITTLKRVWGRVKYDSSPNMATLDALAGFTGFDDWRKFKQHCDTKQAKPKIETKSRNIKKPGYLLAWVGAAAILSLVVILISSGKTAHKTIEPIAGRKFKFSARKVADGLPNSVVFDYDVDARPGDSATLQQSWDRRRTESLSPDLHQHTSIYYLPGYFSAKLLVNGQVVKETPVYIQTKGWVGLINKLPKAIYLNQQVIHEGGVLGISAKRLAEAGGSPVFSDQWTEFYNVRPFGDLTGKDFTFEADVRNPSTLEQSSCRKITIDILGSENAVVVPISAPGCTSALNVYTSSEWLLGKDHDLSALGCDVDQFEHLGISVINRTFTVTLNGKPVLTRPVTQDIGRVVGICIAFEGAGEIKDVKLGSSRKVYYEERF